MSSLGQVAGGIVGGAIGFMIGGPFGWAKGALYGAQIGITVGGLIDPPKGPTINGPRLSDLSAQTSTYGSPIPRIYGTVATHGNVIWLQGNQLTERVRKEKQGGKGGGGGATVKTYSYYATFAVGLADVSKTGPIQGVRRIWVGGNLIYDAGSDDLETIIASNQAAQGFRIYFGDEDQMPDPRMQADLGVANCPAYRGLAYIVFYDFALKDYGNSLMAAQVKVEVASEWDNPQFARVVNEPTSFEFDYYGAYRDGLPYIESVDGGVIRVRAQKDLPGRRAAGSWPTVILTQTPESPIPPDWSGYVKPCGYVGGRALYLFVGTPFNGVRLGYDPIDVGGVYERIGVPVDGMITSGETITSVTIANNESSILVVTGGAKWYQINGIGMIQRSGTVGAGVSIGGIARGGSRSHYSASFDSDRDEVAVIYGAGNGRVSLNRIEGSTLVLKATSTLSFFNFSYPSAYLKDGIIYAVTGPDVNVFCYVGASEAPERLDEIIKSECLQSGILSLSDIDATDIDQDVRGYRIAATGAIRGALEPLQGAWPFDVIQAGYKIKFVRRGKTPIATIDASELDARQADSGPGVQITIANEMDTQLPRAVSLKYLDIGREYDLSEQNAERLNTDAVNLREMEMPIVLSATEAAGMSEVLLYLYWLERRDVSFRLPPEYRYLEPADVLTVTGEWGQYELRLTRINLESDGRLECYAKFNAAAIYTPTAQGAEGEAPAQTIPLDGPSQYIMLDVPLLSDSYNSPGWPAAMAGYTAGWPGGVIYRSVDDGQTWTDLQGFTSPVTIGYARGALGAGRFDIVDSSGVLDVDMMAGDLSSIDELAQFAGGNALAYGAPGRWEICSPRTVTLNADGSLRMTDWLRGRFGTEWAASLHQSGDALVLLTDPDLAWVGMESGSIGLAREYRGITAGRTIDTDTNRSETYAGVNLKPLSPVYLNGSIDPSTQGWSLTWTRRGRLSPGWMNNVDVPVGESLEIYEVEIYKYQNFLNVVRTIQTTSASAQYTYENQLNDFGSFAATLFVKIYQVSETVGRGYPLTASISRNFVPSYGGDSYFVPQFTRVVTLNGGAQYLMQTASFEQSPRARVMTSSDGGETFTLLEYTTSSLWAGVSGAKYYDAKYGSRRFSIVFNEFASIYQVITQDGTSEPSITDRFEFYPKIDEGTAINIFSVYADADKMYIIGSTRSGVYLQTPRLYSTTDGLNATYLGSLSLASGVSDEFGIFKTGRFEERQTKLTKFGSRWFLMSAYGLYYTDDAIPLTNWTPISLGLGEGNKAPSLGLLEGYGDYIVCGTGYPSQSNKQLAYSTDNGDTWAVATMPAGYGLTTFYQLIAGSDAFYAYGPGVGAPSPTVLKASFTSLGTWTAHALTGVTNYTFDAFEYDGSVIIKDLSGAKLITSLNGIDFVPTILPEMS